MDIFSGWENYVDLLEKNWRQTIKEDDTVVICGDISWGMTLEESFEDFKFLNSLPGEKILLKGNHDYWWVSVAKIEKFFQENNFKNFQLMRNNSFERCRVMLCGTRGWTTRNMDDHDEKMVEREVARLKLSFDSCKNDKLEKIVFLHYPPCYFGCESKIIDFLSSHDVKKCFYGHIHSENSFKYTRVNMINGINCELVSCDYLKFVPKMII